MFIPFCVLCYVFPIPVHYMWNSLNILGITGSVNVLWRDSPVCDRDMLNVAESIESNTNSGSL